jgi:predicted enzyme related to lactoylglutathione lyase
MKIAMTGVYVNNPLEAFKFYTEILGFKEHTYMPEMYLAIVVSPEEPNGTVLLLEPNNNPIASNYQTALYEGGFPAIVFGVDDIEKEYERLTALGVNFKKPPTKTEWGTQAILEDTCGNYIQIHQMPK